MRLLQLLCLLAFIGSGLAAEPDLTSIVTQTPDCARICTIQVLGNAQCPILQIRSCLCTSPTLQHNLAACVLFNCSVKDQYQATHVLQESVCHGIEQESRWQEYSRAVIILAAITYPIVILRFLSRLLIARKVWWDDWCILASMCFLIPITVLPYIHANQGFGRHFWDIRPQRLIPLRKTFYATQMFYVCVTVLSKLSLLFLYLRIFTDKPFRRVVKYSIVFLFCHGIILVSCVMFQCIPVSSIWTLKPARCLNPQALVYSGAALAIFEDFFILFLPIWELWKLNLSTRRKFALVFMFSFGSFASITSIIRLRYIAKFSNSIDVTWDNVDILIWSEVEIFSSVICASLIAVRPLFAKLVPDGLLPTNIKETLPTPRGTFKQYERWSPAFDKRMQFSRRNSGHLKLSSGGRAISKEGENRDSLAKAWVTDDTDVESESIQMNELAENSDNLAPGFKGKATSEM